MNWLKSIAQEIFGLFVDDGSFAVAILAWLVLLWLALPHLPVPGVWRAALLLGGLVAILVQSVWSRARRDS